MTPSKERLFFFPFLLQRWDGCSLHSILIHSPMSITIMVNVADVDEGESFIQSSNFPDRLRLALYITGFPKKTDCVYRRTSRGFRCVPSTIYPLNRLRNIAIQNSLTSHFVVFDMDMWPASPFPSSLSPRAHLPHLAIPLSRLSGEPLRRHHHSRLLASIDLPRHLQLFFLQELRHRRRVATPRE